MTNKTKILDFTKLNLLEFTVTCKNLSVKAWASSDGKYRVSLGKVCPISLLDYIERCGDDFIVSLIEALKQRISLKQLITEGDK